ncbi:tripartite motif-containing protein 16-like [Chanos chanos]|uniref:Tripartite motif-containing protein 16-like n=1 Tax=Chanos chanos TaxID=29144 RepID=A0A6J2VSX9_CHACN|nr:tripartite motif-containing protein 16-like [Chanos chanos]
MAEASISIGRDRFICPVCLGPLKDPVTMSCGHIYCMGCIKGYCGQDGQKGVYSCPQCRQNIIQRPVLRKHIILAEVMEKMKKTRLQGAAVRGRCSAGPGDVECDFCIGKKEKAVKSCLTCLASYCQIHLQPHYESPALQKHRLVEASTRLRDRICPRHNTLIELWCQRDKQFMCYLCMLNEHRGHKTVPVIVERTEREKQLGETQRKTQQRIQEREKEVQELRQAVESLRRSAQAAVEDTERIFIELIHSIERRRHEVTELIRDQEKSELSQAEGVLERLEQEIADLRRRDTELEQVSHTEDHIHFLQNFPPLFESEDLPSITVSPHLSFEDVGKSVSQLKERVEGFCKKDFERLSTQVTNIKIPLPYEPRPINGLSEPTNTNAIPPAEPKTREEFLQCYCELTFDPSTANPYLRLSEGNRELYRSTKIQSYWDHPDRFDECFQVLCRESVSERCYWEVEWSRGFGIQIAVAYESICRKGQGKNSLFGRNDQSWSLSCSPNCYSFRHKKKTKLPTVPSSSRIGVYVDHRAGTLSFYSVSDTMTLLHRVHTTFTQPLYPGFLIGPYSDVRLCKLSK